MTKLDSPKRLAELLEPGMTLMVGTAASEIASVAAVSLHSRPLTVAHTKDDTIRVLIDTTADFVDQARRGERAHVTLSDNRQNVWVSLNATMTLSMSESEIEELWNPFASAYFEEGRESPNIGVLRLHVTDGMYWSTPSGRLGSLISVIKAKMGDPDDGGEHGAVAP